MGKRIVKILVQKNNINADALANKIKSYNLKKFANLLEQLLFTYSTNRKIEI